MDDFKREPRRIYEFRQEDWDAMTDEQRAVFMPNGDTTDEPFIGPLTEAEAWLAEEIDPSTFRDV